MKIHKIKEKQSGNTNFSFCETQRLLTPTIAIHKKQNAEVVTDLVEREPSSALGARDLAQRTLG